MTTDPIRTRARDVQIDQLKMTLKTVQLQPEEIIVIEVDLPLMREQTEQLRSRVADFLAENNIKAVPLILTATLKVIDVHAPHQGLAERFMDMQEQNAKMRRVLGDLTHTFYWYGKEPQAQQGWLKRLLGGLEKADKLMQEIRGCKQEDLEKE